MAPITPQNEIPSSCTLNPEPNSHRPAPARRPRATAKAHKLKAAQDPEDLGSKGLGRLGFRILGFMKARV